MPLTYRIIFGDAQDMREIDDGAVHLIVTSPPYFTNMLPLQGRLGEEIASFPEELAKRLTLLFFTQRRNRFRPVFGGSGTTMKVARLLGRSCIGYEIDLELLPIVRTKVGLENASLLNEACEVVIGSDARKLRTWLSDQVART